MNAVAPVDTNGAGTPAPEALDFLAELQAHQTDLQTATKSVHELATPLMGALERVEKESADEKALRLKMGEQLAGLVQSQADSAAAVEALQAKLAKQPISKGDHADDFRKQAVDFYRQRWISDESKSVEEIQAFDADKHVRDDEIKLFEVALAGQRKMFRMPTNVQAAEGQLSPEEQHALKTLNTGTGNSYWLTNQVSQEVVECFEERTDIGSLVSSESISRNKITYPLETDEVDDAAWVCETDCDPGIANLNVDGIVSIEAHELRRAVCATHQMIEDSLQPIESYVARRVGRQFTNARNRAFMIGDGIKQPQGMLNADINIMDTSNAGANPGDISWQDFALMYGNTPDPFLAGSEWWISRSAFASSLTIADANNRPIMMNILEGGVPTIMGLPVRVNSYMPEYVDYATGEKIDGSCPIMLVNPKRLYRVVNRIGISVTRDPFTRAACGVVWHFRARMGGAVLCPNAATKLRIKAS